MGDALVFLEHFVPERLCLGLCCPPCELSGSDLCSRQQVILHSELTAKQVFFLFCFFFLLEIMKISHYFCNSSSQRHKKNFSCRSARRHLVIFVVFTLLPRPRLADDVARTNPSTSASEIGSSRLGTLLRSVLNDNHRF